MALISDAVEYEITIDNALIGTQTENSFTANILSDGNHEIKTRKTKKETILIMDHIL